MRRLIIGWGRVRNQGSMWGDRSVLGLSRLIHAVPAGGGLAEGAPQPVGGVSERAPSQGEVSVPQPGWYRNGSIRSG